MNPQSRPPVGHDPTTWRQLSSDLLDGDLVWIPIRHHSPACARHVASIIAERRPSIVLVEGPRTFDEFIPLLLHPEAYFPLAIYSHITRLVDGKSVRSGSYFPLCDYSPELVALRGAERVGAAARFIDADHRYLCGADGESGDRALHDDEHYGFSAALQAAAARAGCRDHNDLWDHLFETTDMSDREFVASVNAFGLLARSTAPVSEMEADGTFERETVMANEIRRAIAEREAAELGGPIAVITGAFHTEALRSQVDGFDRADGAEPGSEPTFDVAEHGAYLIRYSFERLDALNGYGAGMPAPGWYQRLYDLGGDPSADEASNMVLGVLGDVAANLRESGPGGATSTPAMIGALHQARGLSALRGRRRPGRTDVIDAATSCFVQGDVATEGLPILAATRLVLTGDRVGKVPPGAGRPPIALDFDRWCHTFHLPVDSSLPVRVELNIYHGDLHRDKSRFLRRLSFLEIAYAVRLSGPSFAGRTGTHLTREVWTCQVTPMTDVGLVEAGRFGATVELATTARFISETDNLAAGEPSAGRVVTHLITGAELGVYEALDDVVDQLRQQTIDDPDLSSVASGLSQLHLLYSTRAVLDARRVESLPDLITQLYLRACYLMGLLGDRGNFEVEPIADALLELRDVSIAVPDLCEPDLFWTELDELQHREIPPLLAGTAVGLLWTATRVDDDEVVRRVRGFLSGGVDVRAIDGFLRGVLLAAKEIVWQVDGITTAVTEQLVDWDDAEFLARLPGLRAAFSMLTPRETDRIAELVGGHTRPAVTRIDEAALLANLERDAAIVAMLAADGVTGLEAG